MSTITLDYGGANLSYECQMAGHAEPRRAGSKQSSFAQRLTSSVRGEFMVVPLVLQRVTPTQAAAIRALFALGAQVPCRGDVFLNGGATTVVCSGKISDELDQTAAWWTINLTLYEVGSSLGYTPTSIILYLTNVAAGGGEFVASTDVADDPFSAGTASITLMDAPEVIPTCGGIPDPFHHCTVGVSANPEATWESLPSPSGGYIVGSPYLTINSRGGTGDRWYTQAVKLTITLVRAAADIMSFDTDYSNGNGGFSGDNIFATAEAPVVITVQAGDTLRVDAYGRAGLNSGYLSDGALQIIQHGYLGAGTHLAFVTYRGTARFE